MQSLAQPTESALLHKLYTSRASVSQVYTPELTNLFPGIVSRSYADNKQYLIKTSTHLYLGIDGTGQLYELYEVRPGILDAKRIDSTKYAGNNFCAATFSINTAIFSLGGYGFWKTNGTLKQYNFYSREWDVVPLQEERPSIFCQKPSEIYWKGDFNEAKIIDGMNTAFAPSFYWVDAENKLFYAGVQHLINQSVSDSMLAFKAQYNASLSVLDLSTKRWTVLGDILNYGWHFTVHLPWGLLVVESPESIYYTDFKNNRLLYCKVDRLPKYRKFFRNRVPDSFFYAEGYIYFGELAVNSFDSIAVSKDDFEERNAPLFSNTNKNAKFNLLDTRVEYALLLVLLLGAVGLVLYSSRKNRLKASAAQLSGPVPSPIQLPLADRVGILNQMERQLILLLFEQSLKGRRINVETLNKLSGVAMKNEPIRRRTRSELINAVNDKWLIIAGTRERFVFSEKSDFDGRTREYFINEKLLSSAMLKQVIELIK
jgi:hypothetical protein